jgi:antirestriction protein
MVTFKQWHEEELRVQENQMEAFEDFLNNTHNTMESEFEPAVVENFFECYLGQWDSILDYVEEMFPQLCEIPEHLTNYIDFKAVERDWRHDVWISDNGHLFASR